MSWQLAGDTARGGVELFAFASCPVSFPACPVPCPRASLLKGNRPPCLMPWPSGGMQLKGQQARPPLTLTSTGGLPGVNDR